MAKLLSEGMSFILTPPMSPARSTDECAWEDEEADGVDGECLLEPGFFTVLSFAVLRLNPGPLP